MPPHPERAPGIPQFRFPSESAAGPPSPFIYGSARLAFGDTRAAKDAGRQINAMLPIEPGMRTADWDRAELVDVRPEDLLSPADTPGTSALPALVTDIQRFSRVARDFHRWLGRSQRLDALQYPPLKLTSTHGETEEAFLERVRQALQRKRDVLAARLRRKRKSKQSLRQTAAELKALPDMSAISPAALQKVTMRPRRAGATVDLVAVVWR